MRTPKIGGNWDSSLPTVLSFTQNEYGIIIRMTVRVNLIRDPLWTPKCTTRHTKKKCLILVLRELTSHLEVSKHTHEKTTCINQNQAFYHFSQTSPFPHIPLPNDINTFQSPRLEIASCLFLHMKLFLHLSLHSHSSHSLYFGLSCQCKCYCFLVF